MSAAQRRMRLCRTGGCRTHSPLAAPLRARSAPRLRSLTDPTPASSVRSLCAERMRESVWHVPALAHGMRACVDFVPSVR